MAHTRETVVATFQSSLNKAERADFDACDAATQLTIACEELGFDPDAPVLPKAKVFQDGRDFYVGDDNKTDHVVTAPMRVADMDVAAASNARDWFVKIHAPRAKFEPVFVNDGFEPEA